MRALLADRLSLCLLLTADCSLLAAHCSLLTARLSPIAAHCNCIYCCICYCTCCVPRTTPPRFYYNLAHSSSESRLSLEPALNRPPSGPIKSMINESIPERKCVIPSCRRCHHCYCDYPSIYPSDYPSIDPSGYPSVYPSIYPSGYLSVKPSVSLHLFDLPSVLSAYWSVSGLSTHLSTCLPDQTRKTLDKESWNKALILFWLCFISQRIALVRLAARRCDSDARDRSVHLPT